MQGPPSLPFIPGADCCGIVEEVQPDETYFQPGDLVAARFSNAPRDATAEYARVSTTVAEKIDKSKGIAPAAAAVFASASAATQAAEYIKPNERVLVLGAGGGIGSHLCQLLKQKGAFVVGVSKNPQRLLEAPLNCDRAIDYTKENVFEMKEFQDEPFDTIFDYVSGGWLKLQDCVAKKIPLIVKPANQGGRFLAPTLDEPYFEAHSLGPLLYMFMIRPALRSLWSKIATRSYLPEFVNVNDCLPNDRSIITRTLNLAYEGKLEAVIDGPYPMTTEGAQKAFQILASRHAKGKVVIQVAEK